MLKCHTKGVKQIPETPCSFLGFQMMLFPKFWLASIKFPDKQFSGGSRWCCSSSSGWPACPWNLWTSRNRSRLSLWPIQATFHSQSILIHSFLRVQIMLLPKFWLASLPLMSMDIQKQILTVTLTHLKATFDTIKYTDEQFSGGSRWCCVPSSGWLASP